MSEVKLKTLEKKSKIFTQISRLWDSLKDLKKEIAQDMEKLEDRIVHKLTYRALISQVSIGTILVTLMIYFHQR